MKNNLKCILIQFVIILNLWSCSDSFFDEIPSDRTTPDKNFKSLLDAELACIAPLAILRDVAPQMIFASDLLSDMTVITENADLNWQEINNHNLRADNPYIDASNLYKVIINANESLLYIENIAKTDQDITDIDIKVLKGNLIGIRSWAYFTIARLYGEVAYIKDNLPKLTENLTYIPRESMLDTLINNLTPYLDIDYQDYLNLSMYNKALIGEIYLEKQDYENAVNHLIMAIEGFENDPDLYKVNKSYQKDYWKKIFLNAESNISEVMIAVPFDYTNNQINPIELWYGYHDQYVAKPTNFIVDLFNIQVNIRNRITGDIYRGLGASYDTINGNNFVNKYNLEPVALSSDLILYRAADIHLLLAEAMNRSGDSRAALKILSDGYVERSGWENSIGIRKRAYLSSYIYEDIPTDFDAVNYVEDLIVQERALELAFEGKRWTDLMRVARRRGPSYLADKVALKYSDPNMANAVREKLMNEANWYLPFPK